MSTSSSEETGQMAAAKKNHTTVVVLILAAVLTLVYFLSAGLDKAGTQIPGAQNGKLAKNIKVLWIQGQEHIGHDTGTYFELKDFKGKPVILNFWASWCVSCRQEARDIEFAWQKLKKDGVMVVGVAIQDSIDDAERFAKQYGKTYILGLDESGKASIDYGITGVPESFFIDRNGIIVHKEATPLTKASLVKYAELIK
jgi:cytochrome c biogenesis protein CcmG/thiol:disulfide interchange protein DsbE